MSSLTVGGELLSVLIYKHHRSIPIVERGLPPMLVLTVVVTLLHSLTMLEVLIVVITLGKSIIHFVTLI